MTVVFTGSSCAQVQERKNRADVTPDHSSSQMTPSGSPRKSVTLSTPDSEAEAAVFPDLESDNPHVRHRTSSSSSRRRTALRDSGAMGDDEYDKNDDTDSTSYYMPHTLRSMTKKTL